jgi:hypothetical protein
MYIASFDIGIRNFAFCIEEFDNEKLDKIKNMKIKKYNNDGTPTENFNIILKEIYENGNIILLHNSSLIKKTEKSTLTQKIYVVLTELLDSFSEYWDRCDFFIIEQQMSFGRKTNPMAVKLAQFCYSYFVIKYGNNKHIIDFPAKHKTQVLGAEKIRVKKKPDRKKWCVEEAMDILSHRGDDINLGLIADSKKRDDFCDTICQLQAFKYLYFVDKSIIC